MELIEVFYYLCWRIRRLTYARDYSLKNRVLQWGLWRQNALTEAVCYSGGAHYYCFGIKNIRIARHKIMVTYI
jgi:hypothetical protein